MCNWMSIRVVNIAQDISCWILKCEVDNKCYVKWLRISENYEKCIIMLNYHCWNTLIQNFAGG